MSVIAPALAGDDARPGALERLHGWVTTVDHKRLGVMYVGAGLLFLVIAGIEASLMGCSSRSGSHHPPRRSTGFFTMHGPPGVPGRDPDVFGPELPRALMIGARDLALLAQPWFWIFLFGGLLLTSLHGEASMRGLGAGGRLVRLCPLQPGLHAGTPDTGLAIFITGKAIATGR
jgi:cytochrome c oxidase subunit 1